MARANVVLGSLLIFFGSWYLWLTTGAPRRRLPHDPGLMFVPRILAVGLLLLSVLLILREVVPRVPRPDEAPPERLGAWGWGQTGGLLGLTVAYVVLLPWLGFLPATPVYLVAAMLLSGAGWRLGTGVLAAVATGVIYLAFVYFFRVALPPAPFP